MTNKGEFHPTWAQTSDNAMQTPNVCIGACDTLEASLPMSAVSNAMHLSSLRIPVTHATHHHRTTVEVGPTGRVCQSRPRQAKHQKQGHILHRLLLQLRSRALAGTTILSLLWKWNFTPSFLSTYKPATCSCCNTAGHCSHRPCDLRWLPSNCYQACQARMQLAAAINRGPLRCSTCLD